MIRTLLTGLAILSLLCCVAVLAVKWRSLHGHDVEFSLGRPEATETFYRSTKGRVMVEIRKHIGDTVATRADLYGFGDVIAGTMMLPSLWVAMELRRMIRRAMRRRMDAAAAERPTVVSASRRSARGRTAG